MRKKLKEKLENKRFLVRFITAAFVLLILITAAVYTVFIQPNKNEASYIYVEESVVKGDLILGIMESGSVALQETSLDYELELDLSGDEEEDDEEDEEEEETIKYLELEEVYIVSGQRIAEEDALFKLTEESMEAVEKRLNTSCTEAKIALAEAETEYKIQLLQAKSTYDTGMLEAERAQTAYNASSTKTKESISVLSADIQVLTAENDYNTNLLADEELWESLEDAQTAYTSAKNIFEDTDVHNATAYADNYTNYKSAKDELDVIQEQIDELNETIGTNQKSIEKKKEKIAALQSSLAVNELTNENAYDSAVLGGELAQDIYDYTVNSLSDSVDAAQADMEAAENNLEEYHSFVKEDGVIYADGAGIVTNVSYEEGDFLTDTGAMLNYVKEDAYTVTIDVSEEDIAAVAVGDEVDITMTAYPDQQYTGTVLSITTTAASDYATTVSYPVVIKAEGDTSLLYGGMTAEVTFVTDSVSDVLYVSRKAVQEIDGKSCVYVKTASGDRKLAEVETGFTDGTHVEIISGLSEGDTVYLQSKITGSEEQLRQSTGGGEDSGTVQEDQTEAADGNGPAAERGGFGNENGDIPAKRSMEGDFK